MTKNGKAKQKELESQHVFMEYDRPISSVKFTPDYADKEMETSIRISIFWLLNYSSLFAS